MTVSALLGFLIIGLIAGWLAGQVMKGGGYGIVGDMIIGVIGAFLGGWLFSLMGITAFVGAIILIFLLRMIKRA